MLRILLDINIWVRAALVLNGRARKLANLPTDAHVTPYNGVLEARLLKFIAMNRCVRLAYGSHIHDGIIKALVAQGWDRVEASAYADECKAVAVSCGAELDSTVVSKDRVLEELKHLWCMQDREDTVIAKIAVNAGASFIVTLDNHFIENAKIPRIGVASTTQMFQVFDAMRRRQLAAA